MKLTFLGATNTVTGSKYLLEVDQHKFLIDCGLFQGHKELRLRNWRSLSVDPKEIDAVILTHAHLDHSGYLPLLAKQGFSGPIYCSQETVELCGVLLPDSGYLQEEDARYANKYGFSKHKPALPLYTRADAVAVLSQFKAIKFDTAHQLLKNLQFSLLPAGHILGASLVEIRYNDIKVVFSGDLGRPNDPIMKAPTHIWSTDYLILESTYGDRAHLDINPAAELTDIINRTVKRGGMVLIPAFAVGRSQLLLYYVYQLMKSKKIPELPVYLDSPMAIAATKIFMRHAIHHRLTKEQAEAICHMAVCTETQEESKQIDAIDHPMIVISASGMATGGRVLHHLKRFVTDAKNTVLFTGYQAAGTRGDKMLKGIEEIKIHGGLYPVRAEILQISNTSAHSDYKETLEWLSSFTEAPKKIFLTHGEPEAARALKSKIEETFGWQCMIPRYLDTEALG
ncbi:MAG: MBL fold metallo-hydrolase [Gammaproteobacteria bacterium]|nr:MBL fold metallo-hydrolase [Gammaproteobacteria bacterium]